MDMFGDVARFHEKFNQAYEGPPRKLTDSEQDFRIQFQQEETTEYVRAVGAADDNLQLDALCDIVFVAMGTAYKRGWNFNEAWRRVVAANMAKEFAPDGKWKIIKPPGWTPPDHSDLVR